MRKVKIQNSKYSLPAKLSLVRQSTFNKVTRSVALDLKETTEVSKESLIESLIKIPSSKEIYFLYMYASNSLCLNGILGTILEASAYTSFVVNIYIINLLSSAARMLYDVSIQARALNKYAFRLNIEILRWLL